MKISKGTCLASVIALGLACTANAGVDQVGDLRIGAATYETDTPFDPGFTETTRSVAGAPVEVNSTLTGGSQNAGGGTPSTGTDVFLRTYSSVTQINNLSRYTPSLNGGASGPARVGMIQWNIDLTPIDGYLAGNALALTALDLDFNFDPSDDGKKYDIYLSYTNAGESISLASIDNSTVGYDGDGNGGAGSLNWTNFFNPARGSTAGDIINGTHKVLAVDITGNLTSSESLLALYNAGVREINLQIAAGDYWAARQFKVNEGAGISITTEPVPEPASLGLISAGLLLVLGRRRA